jgi:hypothetical protein
MGMTTPAAVLHARLRQTVSMKDILEHYGVQLIEVGEDDSRMRCDCPLPSHPSITRKYKFRIYGGGGRFSRWTCYSESCRKGHSLQGDDVITFVALMEGCDLPTAAGKLVGWFSSRIDQPR